VGVGVSVSVRIIVCVIDIVRLIGVKVIFPGLVWEIINVGVLVWVTSDKLVADGLARTGNENRRSNRSTNATMRYKFRVPFFGKPIPLFYNTVVIKANIFDKKEKYGV
jgi:hypothetical protein